MWSLWVCYSESSKQWQLLLNLPPNPTWVTQSLALIMLPSLIGPPELAKEDTRSRTSPSPMLTLYPIPPIFSRWVMVHNFHFLKFSAQLLSPTLQMSSHQESPSLGQETPQPFSLGFFWTGNVQFRGSPLISHGNLFSSRDACPKQSSLDCGLSLSLSLVWATLHFFCTLMGEFRPKCLHNID